MSATVQQAQRLQQVQRRNGRESRCTVAFVAVILTGEGHSATGAGGADRTEGWREADAPGSQKKGGFKLLTV
jgi:hypothetical protein